MNSATSQTSVGSGSDSGHAALAPIAPAPIASLRRTPLRQLSSGPDGSVTLARLEPSGELIELRHATVIHTDPARWEHIESAAQVYGLIEHPDLRRMIGVEIAPDGTPVLLFAEAPERDLDALLLAGPMPEHEVYALAVRIADVLSTMHRFGLAHQHVCPSAVRIRDDGTPLLDFAWLDLGARAGQLDAACAPPELGREPLDVSSDVYALGALLRVLLLGRSPTPAEAAVASEGKSQLEGLLAHMLLPLRDARPTLHEVCDALHSMRGIARRSLELSPTRQSVPANSNLQPTAAPLQLREGMMLGRFELLRRIGVGGMGEVFEAIDRASGERAALKVLRAGAGASPAHVQRFRKEARILSQIRSPHVANLIEWNQDAGLDYMALEFVSGGDLAHWFSQQGGRISEQAALTIVAEVCRGLGDAHARGIVHRDIKPQNIMIEGGTPASDRGLRLKLCDFGIARSLESKTGTIAFTEHDKLIGTPDFMAPEQATGSELTPATDVYALGVMLFMLISGRFPFELSDTIAILVAHTTKAAPKLAEVCPEVSEATAALVERMLAKSPVDRFADANLLLEAIERILKGAPSTAEVHPARPATPPNKVVRHVFEYQLEASPEALWPYVSNTDRLNRAVGLPPAAFKRVAGALGVETYANNRVLGVSLRWREHPFEWVEGRRWGVLRVFEGGVMRWFTVELELEPKPGGGTLLRYAMTLEPRHWVGKMLVAIEMRLKQQAALARVFARIDEHAKKAQRLGPAAESSDAFEVPPPLTDAQRQALTRCLERLAQDGVRPQLLDALAKFCEQASAQEVSQLRPLEFAQERGLDADDLVDACLRGAHHGLFVLLWEVLCPSCRIPSDFAESLRALADHGHCPSCNTDFALDFAQSLELVFRVSRDIRETELRTYCVGGPAFAPHVVAQMRLAAKERMALALGLTPGAYKIRSPQLPYAYALQVSPLGVSQRGRVRFTSESPHEARRILVAPGAQHFELINDLERELVVRVERAAPRENALTAARAACLPSFRKLFPGEVLASGRLVAVGRTAFLVAAVQQPRQLMHELGDARAFELMLKLIERTEDAVAAEGGAMVKSANAAVLCAFDSADAAARTALALRAQLDAEPAAAGAQLVVHITVHQGPAVAATVDGRLDYFGQTVETALDLCAFGSPHEVLLSTVVAEDPHVVADLSDAGSALELIELAEPGRNAVRVTRSHTRTARSSVVKS